MYRDLKPSNVGFDAEGVVKVFDFGLSRELPNEEGATIDDVFQMSGKVGSMRYMAPEVVLSQPYNQKADVYSFSLVMWEILTLEKPFGVISKRSHRVNVIENEERPVVEASWTYGLRKVLKQGWRADAGRRPAMKEIHSTLSTNVEQLRQSRLQSPPTVPVLVVQ
jgi:serine/threonine protein kinase